MNIPDVAILVITYNRYQELKQTIEALMDRISYPRDHLHLIVSDDSTGGNYLNNLRRNKRYYDEFASFTTIETPERSGWGKHVNFALNYVEGLDVDYVLQLEDDYVLSRDLDLLRGVSLMEVKDHIGMLRYRGTGGSNAILHQKEADIGALHPEYIEAKGYVGARTTYCLIDNASALYACYSHGPHLKRMGSDGFHAHYGDYPEGLKLGETEEYFAKQVKNGMTQSGAKAIAIFPDWIAMQWDHIGETWKGSKDDI